MVLRIFTAHPASVGESYLQHLVRATCVGTRMLRGGIACIVHGLLPFLFVATGSRTIATLYEQVVGSRNGGSTPNDDPARPAAAGTRDLGVLS